MIVANKKVEIIIFTFFINIIYTNILTDILINFFNNINTLVIFIENNSSAKLYTNNAIFTINNTFAGPYMDHNIIVKK